MKNLPSYSQRCISCHSAVQIEAFIIKEHAFITFIILLGMQVYQYIIALVLTLRFINHLYLIKADMLNIPQIVHIFFYAIYQYYDIGGIVIS